MVSLREPLERRYNTIGDPGIRQTADAAEIHFRFICMHSYLMSLRTRCQSGLLRG